VSRATDLGNSDSLLLATVDSKDNPEHTSVIVTGRKECQGCLIGMQSGFGMHTKVVKKST